MNTQPHIAPGQRYWIPDMPDFYVVVERVTPTRVCYAMQEEDGPLFRSEHLPWMGTEAFESMVRAGDYLLTSSAVSAEHGKKTK